jgi:hypothetical protein
MKIALLSDIHGNLRALERRGGTWEAELVTVPYDPAPMARLASLRGRDEWAMALLKGSLGGG